MSKRFVEIDYTGTFKDNITGKEYPVHSGCGCSENIIELVNGLWEQTKRFEGYKKEFEQQVKNTLQKHYNRYYGLEQREVCGVSPVTVIGKIAAELWVELE